MTQTTDTASGTALFLGPHPDDIEIFAGGTAHRLARLGHRVVLCDLTRGERASNGTVEERAVEAREAGVILGASERRNLGFPDTGIREADEGQVSILAACIRELRPDVLVAPWTEARHPDHAETGRLAIRAAFLAGLRNAEVAGRPHRPTSVLHYVCRIDARPSFVVPLDEADIEAKRRAIAAHASQVGTGGAGTSGAATLVGESSFLTAVDARDRTWGAHAGAPAAEAFVSGRTLIVDDPVAWALAHPADAVHWFPGTPT